jgi:hypothetical protein
MKKNMIIKMAIVLLLISSSVCLAKGKEYNNELEFGDPSAKKVLQIGGNGNLNITGYKGNKVLISASEDILEEADRRDEKAKGLKKIRGGGFNIFNNTKDNIIIITRPVSDNVDLDIKVPNGITLKLGNGIAKKSQNLKNLNNELRSQNRELEERAEELKEHEEDIKETETQLKAFEKSMKVVQKMQEKFYVPAPAPVAGGSNRYASPIGIIDGDISIRDFTGVIEVNTVNGNIIAENISGEAVASTVDGDINMSFSNLSKDQDQYFSTVDGDIDITLPKETKADILARTMDGDVYTGFDVDLDYGNQINNKKGNASQNFFNPYYNSNFITARINGGGIKVYLNTINGNIYIRKSE